MADCVAGTDVMLRRSLEGAVERLPRLAETETNISVVFSSLALFFSTLMTGATRSSETSDYNKPTRSNFREDLIIHTQEFPIILCNPDVHVRS
jgi:hypothetical protein